MMSAVDRMPPDEDDLTSAPTRPSLALAETHVAGVPRHASGRSPASFPELAVTLSIAAAAAVATGLARGAPTGIAPLDTAFKVLLALVCVAAGRRAPWPFLAAAGAVAAAACYGSAGALVAVGVLAIALVGWRADRPREPGPWSRTARSAAAAALAGMAVRASWPHVSLMTSLLAGVVVLLILVPAAVAAPAAERRLAIIAAGLAVLAALLLSAVAAAALLQARAPLQTALTAARNGLSAAEHGDQSAAIAEFRRADTAFQSASGDLAWARASEVVPIVSQQVRAIRSAAAVGRSLARAGLTTATSASVSQLAVVSGTFPVRQLESYEPIFREDLAILARVNSETSSWSSPWLLGALKHKLAVERSRLQRAQRDAMIALLGSQQVPIILGATGPRTYLVLVENPAESRASGGVIGDYAEVRADDGRLHLVKVGSVEQLNNDGVPPVDRKLPAITSANRRSMTDFIDRYESYFPQGHWQNIVMSPDFETVGEVASYLFPQSGGVAVNGVISVDPVALAGLLEMIGPVRATGLGEPVTRDNVVPFLAHDEFVEFPDDAVRIKFVESLLKQVFDDLVSRSLPPVSQMVEDLRPAVEGGHLMMYSDSAPTESFFKDVRIAGASWPYPPPAGDFVGVVTQNGAGNKIDWYLRRKIAYDATLNLPSRTITSTLTLTLTNSAPSSGQPPTVIDGFQGTDTRPGEALVWVSIYSPWRLLSASENGRPVDLTSQFEGGRNVYGAYIALQSDDTAVLQLHLAGSWRRTLSHYVLGWYQQPMLFPDEVSTKVTVIH